jgi:murein L,D-transpeptidase YafK
VRGDLLLARSRPLQTFGDVVKSVPQERIEDLRDEALMRLRARQRPAENLLPRYVLQLHPEQKHVLVVDSRRARLYVYANAEGRPRLIADYYVTLGKNGIDKTREGDQKTPVGVYHVTANLPRSKLSDFYGAGAFPINYPNEWDKRLGRNGYGIWLHGVPADVYSRPPRASDGCIVLANPDLLSVGRHVQVGLTPVIIADEIEWSDAAALEAERASLAAAIEQWRADWQSRDTERYLTHYSEKFVSGSQDYAAWAAHKRTVNAAKTWIRVGLTRVAMFRYPREADFVVVTFDQDYRSSGLSNAMKKRQYWIKESGRWKIHYEGAA